MIRSLAAALFAFAFALEGLGAGSQMALAPASPSREMPSRAFEGSPSPPVNFRAPGIFAPQAVALARPLEKRATGSAEEPGGRLQVATVRALGEAARAHPWSAVEGGYVTRLRVYSEAAHGLRAKLDLARVPAAMEVRVQGSEEARIETMPIEPTLAGEAWTPWSAGSSQLIEIFSPVLPAEGAVRVGALLHFTQSPFAKAAAGACTVRTLCSSGDPVLDAAIAERKKSVMRLTFVDNGSGYLCTATLINTERFPAPFVLTANHCINNDAAASSISTLWFYESTACGDEGAVNPGYVQLSGGMQFVFTNFNVDSTLLLMNQPPPAGAVYSAWNPARLASANTVVSISHPSGDTSRYALGAITKEYRIQGRPQDMYGVSFSRGIIQGGSSGSGLFALSGSSLQLRGILSGSTIRNPGGMSCTDLTEEALYTRFEIFEPEIDQYIRIAPQAPDDAPNRAQDLFNAPVNPSGADLALNLRFAPLAFNNLRIDYAGDLDLFRFFLTAPATVTVGTQGALDTVGTLLDSRGVAIEANDDVAPGNVNFGITRHLDAGTYYVLVGHWDATATGLYNLQLSAAATEANYTDLWWNPAESGWGLNLNHQGSTLFATLFTYDLDGSQMWLVMSNGAKLSDGSYFGPLYRSTGPAFNSTAWPGVSLTAVGTMRLTFSTADSASLTYSVNGVSVTKNITRQAFSTKPSCVWSTTDRSSATNYQDLWWNPAESGWGVNIAHQGDTLFATLFTYAGDGRGMWLVMSNGTRTSANNYSGTLYRSSGPAFSAPTWAPPASLAAVGTMSFAFSTGNAGTLTYGVNGVQVTKAIQRQVFATPTTQCTS